jgi:hypothetical protein
MQIPVGLALDIFGVRHTMIAFSGFAILGGAICALGPRCMASPFYCTILRWRDSSVLQSSRRGRRLTSSGSRMRASCRLMAKFALQQAPAVANLKRLFGTRDGFDTNIRGLLEYRLAQVLERWIDPDLRNLVLSAVRDLEPNPELSLKWVRSVANRALALIWEAELPPNKRLPDTWVNEWKLGGERLPWLDDSQRLPRRQGPQCNVLRLMTGADNIRPLARFATKPTALLLDSLQSVGDFGQHRDDFPESTVTKGFAACVVLCAIELIESLARDLLRGKP